MQLERAACGDECHAARAQVRAEFPDLDEVLFFGLCRVELVRERIAAEIVQRVAEARRARRVDREHVHPLGVPIGQIERLRFEPTACKQKKKKTSTSEPGTTTHAHTHRRAGSRFCPSSCRPSGRPP